MNPIEEALAEKQKLAADYKKRDLDQWHSWNKSGRKPEHLEPLLKSYDPLVEQKMREWGQGAVSVQPTAMKAEIHKQLIKAFETFDPNRGTALMTHVYRRLPKAQRFRTQHQNIQGYIPEAKASLIGPIQRAQESLKDELGREPTVQEVAKHIGKPVKTVTELSKQMKVKAVPSSRFETEHEQTDSTRQQEVLGLLRFSLTPKEQEVFDYLYGINGKPKIESKGDIARRLNMSASQTSRIVTSILQKGRSYL